MFNTLQDIVDYLKEQFDIKMTWDDEVFGELTIIPEGYIVNKKGNKVYISIFTNVNNGLLECNEISDDFDILIYNTDSKQSALRDILLPEDSEKVEKFLKILH